MLGDNNRYSMIKRFSPVTITKQPEREGERGPHRGLGTVGRPQKKLLRASERTGRAFNGSLKCIKGPGRDF